MTRPFNFSAWTRFQDQPVAHPGKIYDLADNDPTSACPVGGPAPYGRVLVRGPQNGLAGVPTYDLEDRYYTDVDSCALPDKDGAYLKTPLGVTYAAAGLSLPLGDDGLLQVLGIGVWTEHGQGALPTLVQPFGLGDYQYQEANCGQSGIATQGRIWAYTETDINVGDALHFRTVVPAGMLNNGLTLLGAFTTVASGDTQPFTQGKVFRPGKAGGAFVVQLTGL